MTHASLFSGIGGPEVAAAMLYSVLPHRTYTIEELGIAAQLSPSATMTALQNLSTFGYLRFSQDGKIYLNAIC